MTMASDLVRLSLDPGFDNLPQEVVHEAKRAVLDTIGCAIGGYSGDASRITRGICEELVGAQESTVIGSGARTSCFNAILANGVMVRYLDFNDIYLIPLGELLTGNHPGELVPAVLALAERERLSGAQVLKTIVMGYDLSARFTDCCTIAGVKDPTIESKGWNGDTRGAYVMPIVAGHLLGLDATQLEHAVGISGSHGMVLGILDATGEEYSMTKNLRFPRTAQNGVAAAMMAKRGFTGPTRVLEGSKGFIEAVMRGDFDATPLTAPVEKYRIMETIYKSVAADGSTHGHVNATLQLARKHDIRPEDVAAVRIRAGSRCVEHTGDPVKKYPKTKESADHSSYYLTAIAIVDREVGPNQYTPAKWTDPKVLALIDKVTFEADPSLDSFGCAGISEIRTKQGKVFSNRVDYPPGSPNNPMPDADLERKLRAMADPYMSASRIDRLVEAVYALDKADNIDELMRCTAFDRAHTA